MMQLLAGPVDYTPVIWSFIGPPIFIIVMITAIILGFKKGSKAAKSSRKKQSKDSWRW